MASVLCSQILSCLWSDQTPPERQLDALRSLKNDILGHVQQKELWIEAGVLIPLVKILSRSRRPAALNGRGDVRMIFESKHVLHVEDGVRLQTLQILGSLAHGGPAFLAPLEAANALPVIIENVSLATNPPKVVFEAIRVLRNMVDASLLSFPGNTLDPDTLAAHIFSPRHIPMLRNVLEWESATEVAHQTKTVTAALIHKLCRREREQAALADSGVLDALASIVARHVVARGQVIPGADKASLESGLPGLIPEPARYSGDLTTTLDALTSIIGESVLRAAMLTCSPSMLAIFPFLVATPRPSSRPSGTGAHPGGVNLASDLKLGAMDSLLPVCETTSRKSSTGVTLPPDNVRPRQSQPHGPSTSEGQRQPFCCSLGELVKEGFESPMVPWLIHLMRATQGRDRLSAAGVLAALYKAGLTLWDREGMLRCLVIPLVCAFLKDDYDSSEWVIAERAPAILAHFVAGSEPLQRAAHDCGVIKTISKMFVHAAEPVEWRIMPNTWRPRPKRMTVEDISEECAYSPSRLGRRGLSPLFAHRIQVRESCLKVISAMAAVKEEYRLALAENDIIPVLVTLLPASPSSSTSSSSLTVEKDETRAPDAASCDAKSKDHNKGLFPPYGDNPKSAIMRVCHAIRMFTRSISTLRTRLHDHGFEKPIFRLLQCSDMDVKVAASGVICNLVVELSPMREPLIERGIARVLCECAHSSNAELRFNAVWALKHLVHGAPIPLRKQCIEYLEPDWLVQLVCDDVEDEALFTRMNLGPRASKEADGDITMSSDSHSQYTPPGPWRWPGLGRIKVGPLGSEYLASPIVRESERKLESLRDLELNLVPKARQDDLAVQEQALSFIRNLLNQGETSTTSATTKNSDPDSQCMVDYLFSVLDQDRFFEILASKLRNKVLHPFTRRPYGATTAPITTGARVLYPQARIVSAVTYILVHMAAGQPRHRQTIVSQTVLLELLLPQFNNPDMEVRLALCNLIKNLVWQDDWGDANRSGERARQLKQLGILEKLESMHTSDDKLEVRQVAEDAAFTMRQQVDVS